MLAWALQSGSSVLLSENSESLQSFWEHEDKAFLNQEQMNRLYAIDQGKRYVIVDNYDFPDDSIDLSLTQPKATVGIIDDDDVYRNRFARPGKPLESNIIIENGAIRKLKNRGREFVPEQCHEAKNYLVVDSIVDEEYGDKVLQGFRDAGLEMYKIVTPADAVDESGNPSAERHKTLAVFSNCVNKILDSGISKNTCIVSLGGGVVNNLCGFLASSLYRGITLVHITTSMMGMTDAAIDFKQAVNHQLGKNLLGSYYPATNIIIDPEVLETLSERHILNGIAEALKHALCQSRPMTEAIVEPLSKDLHKALRDSEYLQMVCRECIDHKTPTLTHYHESDFNEMVPQYGHAIAHAVEHLSFHSKGVSPLLHGEAVAIGMCVTAEVGKILGVCDQATVDEHYDFISRAGLPVYIPDGISTASIQNKLCYDKHYVKKPTMGLLTEIGHMHCNRDGSYSVEIDNDVIKKALAIHMERRDNADETTDLYTVEASQTLKSSSGYGKSSTTSLTAYSTSSSEDPDESSSDDGNDSPGNSFRQVEWDPMTATKFGVMGGNGCYCNPWECRC
jgi:3-dehydroquinate synthase